LLDVFRSTAEIRKQNAHSYAGDIEHSRAVFQRYLKSCRAKRDLIERIAKAAHTIGLVSERQPLPANADDVARAERNALLAMFDQELVDLTAEEQLTEREETLVKKMDYNRIFNLSASLKTDGHLLEQAMLLFHALSAVVHKELVLARKLQTDLRAIFGLTALVEHESKLYWALPLNTHDMFDAMLHSSKEDDLAASLEAKMERAEKKMDRAIERALVKEEGMAPERKTTKMLCKDVYELIIEDIGCPWRGWEEAEPGLQKMKEIIRDYRRLTPFIERVVADPKKRELVMRMFPDAYARGDFDHIDLYT